MQGSVKKIKTTGKTSWGYHLQTGRSPEGKKQQITKQGFGTKREAADALRKVIESRTVAPVKEEDPRTFGYWLTHYLGEHCKRRCSETTIEGYEKSGGYILPYIKDIKMVELEPAPIQAALNKLNDSGGKKGKPLSAKTVREIGGLVSMVCKYAIRLGGRSQNTNPMVSVNLPDKVKKESAVLEAEDMDRIMEAVKEHPWLEILTLLDLATGCRRGELLALTWADINFDTRTVTISKALAQTKKKGIWIKKPKGGKPRMLRLAPSTLADLATHQIRQQAAQEMFGDVYRTDLDLVIADHLGDYLRPGSVSAKVSLLMRRLKMPKGVSLHTLRHSHGSHLLSEGVTLLQVSKRLGHANVQITAEVYSHALKADDPIAAEAWERIASRRNKKV